MGQFERGGAYISHADTSTVLHEAKNCYADGHFVATQLLVMAFVEHVLYEKLEAKGLYKRRMSLEAMVRAASEASILQASVLSEIDRLRSLRNPFVHREAGQRVPGLGERFLIEKVHPTTLLEQDAKDSIALMYAVFEAWLSDA
jgi:hypothetical protein